MNGRIVHFEVPFDDADRAHGFYREVFGWDYDLMPEMNYTMVTTGPRDEQGMPSEPGFVNGGMFERSATSPTSPVLVINVESIDDSLKKVGELGGSTVRGRAAVGDMGFSAYFTDCEGNTMGLWENA